MKLKTAGVAGTLESSDIMIRIEPQDTKENIIYLKSTVEKQYGEQIRGVIRDTLARMNVDYAKVTATDRGALDCTIYARVMTAIFRANGNEYHNWKLAP